MPIPIDRHRLQELIRDGVQLVEVLPEAEYAEEHLPGAIHLPLRAIGEHAAHMLDPERPVAVYCWDAL